MRSALFATIRKEPRPNYVSTLEAVMLALQILEPETDRTGRLLAAFDAMIDTQIRCKERRLRAATGT